MKGQRLGYIRVSSYDQNSERQLNGEILDRIFSDKASGKDVDRSQLKELIRFARNGDKILVHSMDRLARNLDDLRNLVKNFTSRGVSIQFIKEGLTFTGEDSPMSNLLLSVMGAFAEFERALLNQRYDYIYLSGISLAILPTAQRTRLIKVLTKFKNQGGKLLFDNNYRPSLWTDQQARVSYQAITRISDIALLTDDDEYALFGESQPDQIIARHRANGLIEMVIKRGAQPCMLVTQTTVTEVAVIPVSTIIDTTAAGDSFAAGYLYRRLLGSHMTTAAEYAHRLAGIVIAHQGAIIDKQYIV